MLKDGFIDHLTRFLLTDGSQTVLSLASSSLQSLNVFTASHTPTRELTTNLHWHLQHVAVTLSTACDLLAYLLLFRGSH